MAYAISIIAIAGITKFCKSTGEIAGIFGTGKPDGKMPTTATPYVLKANNQEINVPTTNNNKLTGNFLNHFVKTKPINSVHTAIKKVYQLISDTLPKTVPRTPKILLDGGALIPNSLGNWLAITTTARPAI